MPGVGLLICLGGGDVARHFTASRMAALPPLPLPTRRKGRRPGGDALRLSGGCGQLLLSPQRGARAKFAEPLSGAAQRL